MTNKVLERMSIWMHRNAREVDLAVWRCLFEGGESRAVADALLYFQNPDGGFGHGYDPDNWNAESLDFSLIYALETLETVDFWDMEHPVFKGILRYLNSTGPENWHFTRPSNADYPHASFYNHSEAYDEVERLGVIIALEAFVLEHCKGLPVYGAVLTRLSGDIARLENDELGDMGPSGFIRLISAMEREALPGYDYLLLWKKLSDIVNKGMQKDEAAWASYGYRPSDYIHDPESVFLPGNEAYVELECEYLLRTLPEEGMWPVSWQWFDNAALYPREEGAALRTAMARKGTEKALFLRSFGKL